MEGPLADHCWSRQLDRWLLHPVVGTMVLPTLLFQTFQAVFAWAVWPTGLIEEATALLVQGVNALLPDGLLKGLLVDGVIAGVGGVLVFLPQILILFFFMLVLEESGYLPRAALLLVYALLIGAFIPNHPVWGGGLQGLVLFGLYLFGIVSGVLVAWVVKLWRGSQATAQLMMELPDSTDLAPGTCRSACGKAAPSFCAVSEALSWR